MNRPRRSTRPPARLQAPVASAVPAAAQKRKPRDPPPPLAQTLLTNPKSRLTSMDISELINAGTWGMLSPAAQHALSLLLPPTAFLDYNSALPSEHPALADAPPDDDTMPVDVEHTLDPAVFTDAHFLAAAHTLQDHIFSGWNTPAHAERVRTYEAAVRDGSLAAPWKDDVWAQTHKEDTDTQLTNRAGEAAEVRLTALTRHRVLRAGDILAYKRTFVALNITIEKEAWIESIHPKTQALTVHFQPGTTQHVEPSAQMQEATVTSPTMLETALLDTDGRVERARRPNGNAWKCFVVWRDGVSHGTLFYLRGTYYHQR